MPACGWPMENQDPRSLVVDRRIKLYWPGIPLRIVEEGDVVRVCANPNARTTQPLLMGGVYTLFFGGFFVLLAGPARKQSFELSHLFVGLTIGLTIGVAGWVLMRSTVDEYADFLSFNRRTRELRVHAHAPMKLSDASPVFANKIGKLRAFGPQSSVWHASATCVTADGQRVRLQIITGWMSRGADLSSEFFRRCG